MSKAFEFELGQRVNVPKIDGKQGVIVGAVAEVLDGIQYTVRWIGDATGDSVEDAFGQSALRECNPSAFEIAITQERQRNELIAKIKSDLQRRLIRQAQRKAFRKRR